MPTIDVSFKDLQKLVGKSMTFEQLKDEYILFAKGEVDDVQGDMLKLDIKDTNRPDLWSAEGIAREIQGRITKRTGMPKYNVGKSKVVVNVDRKNEKVRPYTVCAVAKGVSIDENVLSQMIQLQEKVCNTFGRNRKEVALGVYDLGRIKSPIRFTTVRPDGIKFVPLEFDKEMTPREILREHPKGKEFGHLLAGWTEYPLFIDSAGNVLSIPPIINSNYTGKVTTKTRDLFIECSGFNFKFLMPALNIVIAALADRGARIQTVEVMYPNKAYNNKRTIHTPDMTPKKFTVSSAYINKVSGLGLEPSQMKKLLEQARHDVSVKGKGKATKIEVTYPAYRQDIMHPRDVTEDVIISYGYNNIEPVIPRHSTIGSIAAKEVWANSVAEVAVGLGLQEILSYTLTNKDSLFKKMGVKEWPVAEIENPVSMNWNVFRTWLLPGMLEFLANNQHVEYPQRVFEIGDVILPDETQETKTRDVRKIAVALSEANVSYEKASSMLDAFLTAIGAEYKLKAATHPSFISGRAADIVVGGKKVGVIGEVSPDVLANWKLEMPVAAFELEIEKL
jgi:phenylalanyl-tRNA synthetase beta chain